MIYAMNTQFWYFKVKKKDSVIIMTHEPSWLLDWYWRNTTGTNVSILIQDLLKGRCRIRIAGDLHHYFRHSAVKAPKVANVEHLIVNGCGGAFLHPTHVFAKFDCFLGSSYEKKSVYPSFSDSKRVSICFTFVMITLRCKCFKFAGVSYKSLIFRWPWEISWSFAKKIGVLMWLVV